MKNLKQQIDYQVFSQSYDQANSQTAFLIWHLIWNQTLIQIENQTYNEIRNQVWDFIENQFK